MLFRSKDMKVMKNAIDKIVEEIQSWEDGAHGAAALASPPGINLHGTPAPGNCGDDCDDTPALDPWKRAQEQIRGVAQGL